jgi:hypothetical protein
MQRIILVIILIWATWLGYQYLTKLETAHMLIEQKMEEFYATDFDVLLQKLRKGYEYKTVDINGKKFWISWLYRHSPSLSGDNNKDIDAIEVNGRVDFVELLPFTNFRLGSFFKFTLKIKNNGTNEGVPIRRHP